MLRHLIAAARSLHTTRLQTSSAKFPAEITRLAVGALHDTIRALLVVEPPASHFHQSLLAAAQNMLAQGDRTPETHEHVIAALAALIADVPRRIGSGWKPLFGALKAIRIAPIARGRGV